MVIEANLFTDEIIDTLKRGGIGVLRTDTLYGIVARADSGDAVERVFNLKQRTPTKSPIVLISNPSDMFDAYDETIIKQLDDFWPGKNSIILPSNRGPHWLTRGNESIAYRMPANKPLRELITSTGPLIAPSANPEGLPPANSVVEAKRYFGDMVDFYVDSGVVTDEMPSKLLKLQSKGTFERLR